MFEIYFLPFTFFVFMRDWACVIFFVTAFISFSLCRESKDNFVTKKLHVRERETEREWAWDHTIIAKPLFNQNMIEKKILSKISLFFELMMMMTILFLSSLYSLLHLKSVLYYEIRGWKINNKNICLRDWEIAILLHFWQGTDYFPDTLWK